MGRVALVAAEPVKACACNECELSTRVPGPAAPLTSYDGVRVARGLPVCRGLTVPPSRCP